MYSNFCSNVSDEFTEPIKKIFDDLGESKRIHAIINSYTFNILVFMTTGNIIL